MYVSTHKIMIDASVGSSTLYLIVRSLLYILLAAASAAGEAREERRRAVISLCLSST
jgi:hypothetical protein